MPFCYEPWEVGLKLSKVNHHNINNLISYSCLITYYTKRIYSPKNVTVFGAQSQTTTKYKIICWLMDVYANVYCFGVLFGGLTFHQEDLEFKWLMTCKQQKNIFITQSYCWLFFTPDLIGLNGVSLTIIVWYVDINKPQCESFEVDGFYFPIQINIDS